MVFKNFLLQLLITSLVLMTSLVNGEQENHICQKPVNNTIAGCQDCNRCDNTNTFACTGPNTFVLCLGTTELSNSKGSCQPNHVCNRNNLFICQDSSTGIVASCPSADISKGKGLPPNTSTPILNPANFCKAKQQFARFPLGSQADPNCKNYILCYMDNGGKWNGHLLTCPDDAFFDRSINLCNVVKPAHCL